MSMTIDEMIEVLHGFKAGRKVEFSDSGDNVWHTLPYPGFNFDYFDYRLSKEPKIVPYGPEDGALLVGRKVKEKSTGVISSICTFRPNSEFPIVILHQDLTGRPYSFKFLLDNYLDVTDNPEGVPFGKEAKA